MHVLIYWNTRPKFCQNQELRSKNISLHDALFQELPQRTRACENDVESEAGRNSANPFWSQRTIWISVQSWAVKFTGNNRWNNGNPSKSSGAFVTFVKFWFWGLKLALEKSPHFSSFPRRQSFWGATFCFHLSGLRKYMQIWLLFFAVADFKSHSLNFDVFAFSRFYVLFRASHHLKAWGVPKPRSKFLFELPCIR